VIPFLDALDARVLICDGAMGTMLYGKGVFINRSFDELNLTQPDLVGEIHQAYVRAGADVLETNTFGANRLKLAPFGLGDKLAEINAAGVRIARQAARGQAYVAGAIGPIGVRVEPWGKTGVDEAEAVFREQADALAKAGVDLFMLETFADVAELGAAVRGVRAVSSLPVVAQLTTGDDGATADGTPPEQFTAELEALGADVIGLNCSVGPAAMLETIERIAERTTARLSVQPNAGRPRDVEGRNIYLSSPEYMASYARRFVGAGVRLVGGCCGTTPDHTRQMRVAATASAGGGRGGAVRATVAAAAPLAPAVTPVPRAEKSRLSSALSRGQFVLAVELDPPRGHASQDFVELGRQLRIRGVDALLVSDRPASRARMVPLAAALLLERQAGIETVLQFRCRERRLAAMQAELLGAHALGLRNILVVTGEPARRADYTDATLLVEADSIGVTNAVTRLNHGTDLGGQPIGEPTSFHTGIRVSPAALDLDEEVRRYRYKAEAGAEFALTEPLFDAADLTHFRSRSTDVDLPLLVTIRTLSSLREAERLANEVPGQRVPQGLVERMRQAAGSGSEAAEGIAIAQELVESVRPFAQGIVVSGARPDLVFPVIARTLASVQFR
jgi:methionine synthase I (cobalamin-dependent)/5,10-methylenetetrahydrofolate reductase